MPSASGSVSERAITFGPFRLFRNRKQLLEGDQPVRLGGRALDLLIALVERAGEVVSREELEACVWPKTVVEETSLRAHVSALRRALGEGLEGARYITNVPGRGYCFVASVEVLSDAHGATVPAHVRPHHNLPARLTPTVGRADVVDTMSELLRRRRLVSVAGPGGMGKTTVALAVAEVSLGIYEHGVWFVDLAPVADPRLLTSTVAAAMEIGVSSSTPVDQLAAAIGPRRLLIILDNCEHVIDAAADLALSLLKSAAGISILTTSREPLNVEGEWVYRLGSLDIPPESTVLTATQALEFPAVQLFVQRAMAISERFELVDEDVPALVEICRRLDGMPLAIELAAARIDGLGVQELSRRLADPLQILTRGRRTAAPRHKTLRALLDWSFDLLAPGEQTVLCRLAVFKGGFTLDSACAVAVSDDLGTSEVVECVLGLTVKSLISADASGDVIRYRLPAATHAYASERLLRSGESGPVFHRHARCILELSARSRLDAQRMTRPEWRSTYSRIIDDVRAGLDWSFSAQGDPALGVELAASVQLFVTELGFEQEYVERSLQALEQIQVLSTPQPLLELQLNNTLCFYCGLAPPQEQLPLAVFERTQDLADQLGDPEHHITAAYGHWVGAYGVGDYPRAMAASERINRIAREQSDPGSILMSDRLHAQVQHYLGDQVVARRLGERVLRHPVIELPPAHSTMVPHRVSMPILLGRILWLEGRPDQARAMARQAMDNAADAPPIAMMQALSMLACPLALWRGDDEDARELIAQLRTVSMRHVQAYFQTWTDLYVAVLRARDDARQCCSPHEGTRLLPALAARCHPKHFDCAGTLVEDLVDEATLARVERGIVGWCAPEILRAQASKLWRAGAEGAAASAEAMYLRALDLARRQSALAWELRAASSLGQLWLTQGRAAEATVLLKGVYERFSEGFETADLRAARALMDTLAKGVVPG
jgi:predicted ATPase/DNA-binding winged helix-turn-helix (wHTH) protein